MQNARLRVLTWWKNIALDMWATPVHSPHQRANEVATGLTTYVLHPSRQINLSTVLLVWVLTWARHHVSLGQPCPQC